MLESGILVHPQRFRFDFSPFIDRRDAADEQINKQQPPVTMAFLMALVHS